MKTSSKMNLTTRILARIISTPLRFKITIPYLIVALLLAGLATWMVSQSFARSIEERFRNQLVDDFASVNESVFRTEAAQLASVRAIAYTAGVAEGLAARDGAVLDGLVRPIAVNAHLPLVHIVGASGQPVYSLRETPDGYTVGEVANFAAWEPVRRVLAGESDDLGDKFAGVVEAPWGPTVYTVGPVKQGSQLLGAVLVGVSLSQLTSQLTTDSLAQVTFFRPEGQMAVTTYDGGYSVPGLSSEAMMAITAEGTRRLQNRVIRLGSREYHEALGPLFLRGQPTAWRVGVALPRTFLTQDAQFSPALLAGWFGLAVLAVIGLGVVVAQTIAIPVFDLVHASARVASGHLEVSVKERANDELGLLTRHFNTMVTELRQREFMRDLFGRVVSEEVREALLKGQVGLGGELKVVTVLFTDIREFTTLSENYSPREVVAFLNSYFEIVTGVIRETGGLLNKFGGDSTLAIFGAPVSASAAETAQKAIRAALTIRTRLAEFNARRVEAGQQPLSVGLGINTGEVITGNIGSAERFEYTVIGDTVNTAARVQGLTSRLVNSSILITDSTLNALKQKDQFWVVDHGEIALKGKAKPVRVYGVIGTRLTQTQANLRVGDVPRSDVLEALYLFCRGFSVATIALTKKVSADKVRRWITSAAENFEMAGPELRLAFQLTDAELHRLHDFSNSPVLPPAPPLNTSFEHLENALPKSNG